ncbi:MAG TPA: Abi-alpha family protein [Acidimicrobiales bacterium]|nr:Abi-alpha family protein [Acidimicrobiales bacterium]
MNDRLPVQRESRGAIAPEFLGAARWAIGTAVRSTALVAGWYERQALGLLRARMDAVAPPRPLGPSAAVAEIGAAEPDLGVKLGRLLRQALEQSTTESREVLYHRVLDQLVPDEARILASLSDGGASPVVTVSSRGRAGERVLENMSLVGRSASLSLPQLTPTYVAHLLALGLVEVGPEDDALATDYEVLLADIVVLRALKAASRGALPAKVERGGLRLSPLGEDLWVHAFGGAG